MIVWVFLFASLCFASTQGLSKSNPVVDIDPKGQVAVRLGDRLQIHCKIGEPLRVCRVEIPGEGSIILVPGQFADDDGIAYSGEGLNAGVCGVVIQNVKEKHDGNFICSLTGQAVRTESTANLTIVVAKPPNKPELLVSPGGRYGRHTYQKGEKLEISCSAPSGRPAANVSLYLDDEKLGTEERPNIYDSHFDENSMAVQNVSRTLDWNDNGKTLRCVADHIALDSPQETRLQLQVYYPPQPQDPIERFGYVIGHEGIVNVTIWANPRPRFIWRVNDQKIPEGNPDERNRLQSSTAIDLGKGAWSVSLKINGVQKSDTDKQYILEARNDEGAFEYRINLSTSAEPAGVDLDAGSIIGIVVGVLVLILVVFLLIFARATGRWCFAGSSTTRNLGESDIADPAAVRLLRFRKSITDDAKKRSDTESAGRYSRTEVDGSTSRRSKRPKISLSQLFKRNKDKVSGADTDTMRTNVTVDDEKLQTTEQSAESGRTGNAGTEGGLVYAELDLSQQQQGTPPRRVTDDKTEYAEILYTKSEEEQEPQQPHPK